MIISTTAPGPALLLKLGTGRQLNLINSHLIGTQPIHCVMTSVADPDPDLHPDPHLFLESGSAFWLWIRILSMFLDTIHKIISTKNCQSSKIKSIMKVTYLCLMGPD